MFASGSWDKTIRIWSYSNINGQQCVNILTGHKYSVKDLVFISNRNLLISCSNDKTIRVWDLNDENKPCLRVMESKYDFQNQCITCIKYNKATGRLLSCSWDEVFKVWDIETGDCVQSLKTQSPICSFELCSNIWNR